MRLVLGLTILELALIAQGAPLEEQSSSASENDSVSKVNSYTAAAVSSQLSSSSATPLESPSTVYSFLGQSDGSSAILQMPTSNTQALAASTSDSVDESSVLSQFLNGSTDPTSTRSQSGKGSSAVTTKYTSSGSASNSSSEQTSSHSKSHNSSDASSSTGSITTSAGANRVGLPLVAGGIVAGLVALL